MKINTNAFEWLALEATRPGQPKSAAAPLSPRNSIQGLPSRPPQRMGSPAIVHAALSGAPRSASIDAPDELKTAVPERANFLEKTMGRPDLEALATFLDNTTKSNWVFTGSVAMQIHGHILNYQAAKERISNDVDIVSDESGLGLLNMALRDKNSSITSESRGNADRFKFKGNLDVDVIVGKARKAFGDLHHDAQTLHGLRVMSLPALLRSKTAALDGVDATFSLLSQSGIDAARAKAEGDKAILTALGTIQKTAVPPEFAQSYSEYSELKPRSEVGLGRNPFAE